ncbi:unnamed protein product [Brassica rapa]|uniref:Uncharacterized protein n=1 Tax=Brassica campestris TaxID=3711 RepID=A0A3P6BYF6_BRACM|nr:unnamed protein product [Brassica rapa]VDD02301.1 unnamed protein product [Brassica rapa]
MISNKRIEAVKILVVIMIMFSRRTCEAEYFRRHTSPSRPERFFKVRRPNPLHHHHHHHNHGFINDDYYPPESFSGFLPKTMPIPPSAPSKKHNVYGLQSTNSQRYP